LLSLRDYARQFVLSTALSTALLLEMEVEELTLLLEMEAE